MLLFHSLELKKIGSNILNGKGNEKKSFCHIDALIQGYRESFHVEIPKNPRFPQVSRSILFTFLRGISFVLMV